MYKSDNLIFEIREGTSDYWIIDEVVRDNVYLKDFLEIHSGDLVIDVGAHIGSFSVLASSKGGLVHAYEPSLDNYSLLKKNIKLNKANVRPHREGVMGKSGERLLCIRPDYNHGGNNFYALNRGKKEMVNCVTLDDIFLKNKFKKCGFLKIDCEGAEVEILQNFHELDKVQQVAIEYHGNKNKEEVLKILKEFDLKINGDELGIILGKKHE
jgi:FkbM family methyltransferase